MKSIKHVAGFVLGTLFIIAMAILLTQYSATMRFAEFRLLITS